jgi:hypothetical protein
MPRTAPAVCRGSNPNREVRLVNRRNVRFMQAFILTQVGNAHPRARRRIIGRIVQSKIVRTMHLMATYGIYPLLLRCNLTLDFCRAYFRRKGFNGLMQ